MTFNENWYSDEQASLLASLGRSVRSLDGAVIEIGCWEGKSTCALANAVYPDVVIAVDSWKGNIDENLNHPSVHIAKSRDVLSVFKSNVARLTKGNVDIVVADCHNFLAAHKEPVKFCHIDACHDYLSVARTIRVLLPSVVPGGDSLWR